MLATETPDAVRHYMDALELGNADCQIQAMIEIGDLGRQAEAAEDQVFALMIAAERSTARSYAQLTMAALNPTTAVSALDNFSTFLPECAGDFFIATCWAIGEIGEPHEGIEATLRKAVYRQSLYERQAAAYALAKMGYD